MSVSTEAFQSEPDESRLPVLSLLQQAAHDRWYTYLHTELPVGLKPEQANPGNMCDFSHELIRVIHDHQKEFYYDDPYSQLPPLPLKPIHTTLDHYFNDWFHRPNEDHTERQNRLQFQNFYLPRAYALSTHFAEINDLLIIRRAFLDRTLEGKDHRIAIAGTFAVLTAIGMYNPHNSRPEVSSKGIVNLENVHIIDDQ